MTESIRRTINVSNVSPEVLARKTFGKALFIIDDVVTVEATDRLRKYSSYADLVSGEGSDTEQQRFGLAYFSNGAYGTTPDYMWVLRIDITVGGEDLEEKLTEILELPEDFYFITPTEEFTIAQKTTVAEVVETFADNWYMGVMEYTAVDAYDDGISTDISSVLGALNYEKSFANFAPKVSANNEYLSGAVCGELSGVEYTQTRGKYQPAKKSLVGITVNGLTNTQLGVLIDKNYNYYTATTTIKDNDWYGLNSRNVNGNSFINVIAQDYMSYNITVTLAELLKNTSIIGFDPKGFNLIEKSLTSEMKRFGEADILSIGGVASDGEQFPNGFKVLMPDLASIPAIDKQNGDLKNIVIRYLPKYSVTALEITLSATI